MSKFAKLLLAGLVGAAFIAAPFEASARRGVGKPSTTTGWCKSGKHVPNVKKCKENGGKW